MDKKPLASIPEEEVGLLAKVEVNPVLALEEEAALEAGLVGVLGPFFPFLSVVFASFVVQDERFLRLVGLSFPTLEPAFLHLPRQRRP